MSSKILTKIHRRAAGRSLTHKLSRDLAALADNLDAPLRARCARRQPQRSCEQAHEKTRSPTNPYI